MKRKRRRYNVHISPNNLIAGPWAQPVSKENKMISIASTIILAICIIATTEGFEPIIIILTMLSLIGIFVAPVEFLMNKLLRVIANAVAREEMREREEREKEEMLAEEAKWAD